MLLLEAVFEAIFSLLVRGLGLFVLNTIRAIARRPRSVADPKSRLFRHDETLADFVGVMTLIGVATTFALVIHATR